VANPKLVYGPQLNFFFPKLTKFWQGRREGGEAVIFAGARDSKGAQKSEIDLILGHILVFLRSEKCGISTN
jgi:hypothetical protein